MNKVLMVTLTSALLSAPLLAWSADASTAQQTYWKDDSGKVVRDGARDCVRTYRWSSSSQVEGCDVIVKPEPVVAQAPKVVDGDDDGDGVANSRDRCPNTPRGVPVDASGCPLDSDGDGVHDGIDECPGTPKGAKVNARGCIEEIIEPITYNLRVQFDFDSARIKEAFAPDLQQVADLMANDPGVRIVINGHTDSSGPEVYNKQLSQRRAEAVAQSLISKYGVEASRIRAEGHGESSPIADNSTREGRKQNRRVEAEVKAMIKKKQ